jgi:hypothetical protein
MQHFKAYEIALRRRSDVRDHPTWYSLRECSYYDLFSRPKIIFPDIATQCRFAMDLRGYLIPDGAFMIPAEDYFLLGLLNSCIGRLYFRARCNSIGNPHQSGRLRFKRTYVAGFPVPSPSVRRSVTGRKIEQLAKLLSSSGSDKSLESQIDRLALKAYAVPRHYSKFFLLH